MKRFFALITALVVVVYSCVPAFALDDGKIEALGLVFQDAVFTFPSGGNARVPVHSENAYFFWSSAGRSALRAFSTVEHAEVVVSDYVNYDGFNRSGYSVYCDYPVGDGLYISGDFFVGSGYTAVFDNTSVSDASLIDVGWISQEDGSGSLSFSYYPSLSSVENKLSAFLAELDIGSDSYVRASYRIPSGYVAYIKAQNGSSFSLTANYGFNSVAFADDWGQTGQVMTTGVASLPSSDTKFPLSGMYKIPFRRSENRNLLGQSKVGIYSSTFQGSGYYVIYNPYYMKDFTNLYGSAFELNPTITLTADAISSFRLYPLSQTFEGATSDDWGSESLSGYEDYIDGSVDEEGNAVYQDQTGSVVAPPSDGGTNQIVTPVTNQSIIDRVTSIFNDLISKITSVFTEGYQAIVNLVGLAGPFFAKLSSLYSWLPAPVLSCLSSAMILAVTIGILRAFL